jgi:hypothetical protein
MNIDEAAVAALKVPEHYWGAQTELVNEGWGGITGIHRDSDLLDESNYETILKILDEKYEKYEDWRVESASHWAVGWMDTLMVRVVKCECTEENEDSMPYIVRDMGDRWRCDTCGTTAQYTDIFKECLELQAALENYPVLDEEDYSRREYEDTMEYLTNEVGEEHADKLFSYLFNTYSVSRSDDIHGEWIEEWKEQNLDEDV